MRRTIRVTYGFLAFWIGFGIPGHLVLEHACCNHRHEASVNRQTAAAEACCEGEIQSCGAARCCTETEHTPSHSETPHLHDIDGHRLASSRDADARIVVVAAILAEAEIGRLQPDPAPVPADDPIPIAPPYQPSAALRGPPSA